MDVLSEVLKVVALKGAVFYNAEFSTPWTIRSPASDCIAQYFGPDTGHVVTYHLLTEGAAWAQIEPGPRVPLNAGDIVVFPQGHGHLLGNGPPVEPVDNAKELARILSQGLEVTRMGGGGAITRFLCGYMICDPEMSRLFLSGLPPLLTVNIRTQTSGVWLENSILSLLANANSAEPGAEAVLLKLSEALFTETLRRYVAMLPDGQIGWLAGARDPEVGRALELLHKQPARRWTIESLAQSVGVSRAVLAGRFRYFLGEAPIGYLTRWRLQLAAHLLTTTNHAIAQIAAQVGYDSEAAFNRAFKRQYRMPPARFRRHVRFPAEPQQDTATAG